MRDNLDSSFRLGRLVSAIVIVAGALAVESHLADRGVASAPGASVRTRFDVALGDVAGLLIVLAGVAALVAVLAGVGRP